MNSEKPWVCSHTISGFQFQWFLLQLMLGSKSRPRK